MKLSRRLRYRMGHFNLSRELSLCPFLANPPHLQEVAASLSLWIYFACFEFHINGFIFYGRAATVFLSAAFVCEMHPWIVGSCSSFYAYEVFHYRQWRLKDGYQWLLCGQLGKGTSYISWRRKWQPTPVFLPENPMDREAWQTMVYGVTNSHTRLSNSAYCLHLSMVYLEVHGITKGQTWLSDWACMHGRLHWKIRLELYWEGCKMYVRWLNSGFFSLLIPQQF